MTGLSDKDGFVLVLTKISKSRLAAALGITRQAINNWGDVVPERYAVRVSALTGLAVQSILPETWRKAAENAPTREVAKRTR
jgi:hypothetical protein